MAKTRTPPKVEISAHETVDLRKCALMAAATAMAGVPTGSAAVMIENVIQAAERNMIFLVSGDGR